MLVVDVAVLVVVIVAIFATIHSVLLLELFLEVKDTQTIVIGIGIIVVGKEMKRGQRLLLVGRNNTINGRTNSSSGWWWWWWW